MKIVRKTKIADDLEAITVKHDMPGLGTDICPKGYYFTGYVAATKEIGLGVSGFYESLAREIYEDRQEIYVPSGGFTHLNGAFPALDMYGYLGFDTCHSGLIFKSLNIDKDPYKFIGEETERMAEEFYDLAKMYDFKDGVLEFVGRLKNPLP